MSEILLARLSLAFTVIGVIFAGFAIDQALIAHQMAVGFALQATVFGALMLAMAYGSFVYQLTRLGHLCRQKTHAPTELHQLLDFYKEPARPKICILVPSYKEETHVVRQTILSAALVEYPAKRVVLLIDDPPNQTGAGLAALKQTREMIRRLDRAFATKALEFQHENAKFLERAAQCQIDFVFETHNLAALYYAAADFVGELGVTADYELNHSFAHIDTFFNDRIIAATAALHRKRAAALHVCNSIDAIEISRDYARLARFFDVPISSFERKLYENMSHEPNKAMNLNSYLGLMGGSFYIEATDSHSRRLTPCAQEDADLQIAPADYMLTLDADSLILSDYALRLVDVMEKNPLVAVAQTPYSAVPGAPSLIERTAGATTDIQYKVHQGFTHYNASFWVGANALLRYKALIDIRQIVSERGFDVPVFIQDKTVIEDTGSTIDLISKGWTVFNYPERLAYSATPPDFGTLLIQRRRWANGGLIILPDLLRHAFRRENRPDLIETWIRAHYLCSPALSSIGMLVLLLIPWDTDLVTPWIAVAGAPYYVLYARDLRRAGYRYRDFGAVHALNLLLLPVNLAGVVKSIEQIVTGKKTPFARTPKIGQRTATPSSHISLQWALLSLFGFSTIWNMMAARPSYAAFMLINFVSLTYGISVMIGWRECFEDLKIAFASRRPTSDVPGEYVLSSSTRLSRTTATTRLIWSEELDSSAHDPCFSTSTQ